MTAPITMTPAGPISRRFLYDTTSLVAFIMGPFGSGKTISLFQKMLLFAYQIKPSPVDGVRYMKVMIVRDTYPNLNDKTIPSYFQWLPRNLPGSKYTASPPPRHHLRMDLKLWNAGQALDLGIVDIVVEFRAIGPGSETPEEAFKGWEGNLVIFDEADESSAQAVSMAMGRVIMGRYPAPMHRPVDENGEPIPAPGMVIGALNPPSVNHWVYRDFVEERVVGYKLYQQPSGLSAHAENRPRSPMRVYEAMQKSWASDDDKVKRFIHGEFGASGEGAVVMRDFRAQIMVASDVLEPDPELPLYLGFDAGGTPAMSARQVLPNGQHRSLGVVVAPQGEYCGPERFAEMCKQHFAVRFPNWRRRMMLAAADPSAAYGVDKKAGQATWMAVVGGILGITILPSRCGNDLDTRLSAVRLPMRQNPDGLPGYLVDPMFCKPLISAYSGKYITDEDGKPVKNAASHVADADQYAAVRASDIAALRNRNRDHKAQFQTAIANSDFRI